MRSFILFLAAACCFVLRLSSAAPLTSFSSAWANTDIFNDAPIVLAEGATITLNTNAAHDVFLFQNLNLVATNTAFTNCVFDANSVQFFSSANLVGGDKYILTVNSNSNGFPAPNIPFGIACSQASSVHCNNGQKLQFVISDETLSPSFLPTESPTVSPTKSPTTSSPTLSPTLTPTTSPTQFPTRSPLVGIESNIEWVLPTAAKRFKQTAIITEEETINFDIIAPHTLFRFPSKVAFDTCNFTDAVQIFPDGNGKAIVGDDFVVGETVWFGCDASGGVDQTHCDLGQKIAIEVVPRGNSFALNWFRPVNDAEIANFAIPIELTENDVIEFLFNRDGGAAEQHTVFQFLTKAAFDACDFSNNANFIDIADVGNSLAGITYHDLFADVNDNNILWFGCAITTIVNSESRTHCSLGQKVTVKIVSEVGLTEAPAGEDNNNNDLPIIVGGAVAAVAVVAIAAVVIVKSLGARNGGAARKTSLNKLGFEPMEKESPPAKMSLDVVQKSPYKSPNMNRPQGTTSLAKSKAALSGLDF